MFNKLRESLEKFISARTNEIKENSDDNMLKLARTLEKLTVAVSKVAGNGISAIDKITNNVNGLSKKVDDLSNKLDSLRISTMDTVNVGTVNEPAVDDAVSEEVPEVQPAETETQESDTSKPTKIRRPRYTRTEDEFIMSQYKEGKTVAEIISAIEAKFGYRRNAQYLAGRIEKYNISVSDDTTTEGGSDATFLAKPSRKGPFSPDEIELAIRLFFRGNSHKKIGDLIGRPYYAVRDKLKGLGVTRDNFKGELESAKSGGKRHNQNYTEAERKDLLRYIEKYNFSAEIISIIMNRTKDAIAREARNHGYNTRTIGNRTIFYKLQKVA